MLFQKEEFGQVRVVERNGEPWFVAKDVAVALGYASTNMTTVFQAVPDEWKGSNRVATPGGDQILDNPEFGIQLLTALKEEREARVNAEKRVAILSHVRKTYTTTEIAKELGFRSAVAFNRVLCEQHIQYKQNGTYVLYAEYAELGYVHIKQEVLENDKVVYHRRWTQLGREWLIGRFGIKAA